MIHNTNYMDIEHGDDESQPESWYTKTKPDSVQGLICDENTGANIAVSYDPQHAALIASAPELLAALEKLYNAFQHDGSERIKTRIILNCPDIKEALNTARAIIAKAKGE